MSKKFCLILIILLSMVTGVYSKSRIAIIDFVAKNNVRIFLEEYSPIPNTPDYLKSGLSPDADPLLHNNSIFPLYRERGYSEFNELKKLVHKLNFQINKI